MMINLLSIQDIQSISGILRTLSISCFFRLPL